MRIGTAQAGHREGLLSTSGRHRSSTVMKWTCECVGVGGCGGCGDKGRGRGLEGWPGRENGNVDAGRDTCGRWGGGGAHVVVVGGEAGLVAHHDHEAAP